MVHPKQVIATETSRLVSRTFALLAVGIGIAVLLGWAFDVPLFRSILPTWISMKANTAVCFVLIGTSLFVLAGPPTSFPLRLLAKSLAIIVALIAVLTVYEYAFHVDLHIDQLLVADPSETNTLFFPGRMAFVTAINFLFIAFSLWFIDRHTQIVWVNQLLIMVVFLTSLLAALIYVNEADVHYILPYYCYQAIHTAIAFMFLSIAFFLARPKQGINRILLSNSESGKILRRTLPFVLIFTILMINLTEYLEGHKFYDEGFSTSVITVSAFFLTMLIIYVNAYLLNLETKKSRALKVRMHIMRDASLIFETAKTVNTASANIIRILCSGLGHDMGELWLFKKNGSEAELIANWHAAGLYYKEIIADDNFKNERTSFQKKVFSTTQIIHNMHFHGIVRAYEYKNGKRVIVKEALGVPLCSEDKINGAIIFYSRKARILAHETKELLSLVATQMSAFVEQKTVKAHREYGLQYDQLTGLLNRAAFESELKNTIKKAPKLFAVLKLEIDNFQHLNDIIGHDNANLLFIRLSQKLSEILLSPAGTIARIGPSKLGFILHHFESISELVEFARYLIDIVNEPIKIHKNELFITASIGISIYPENGRESSKLLRYADLALIQAKEEGGNIFKFVTNKIYSILSYEIKIQNGLRRALKNNEFEMYYQPEVAVDGKIIAVEALLRWHDPEVGLRSPNTFIPIAEKSDLIVSIGQWVMRDVIKHFFSVGETVPVSINFSARQFNKKYNLPKQIVRLMSEFKVQPNKIELEFTESLFITDIKQTIEVILALKKMGMRLALDDFGKGYSSYEYLKQFVPDKIKIDKSFIDGIPQDQTNVAIIRAIIASAKALNIKVLAEGVETQQQVMALKELGCDYLQGFYFAKPMPFAEIKALLKKNKAIEPVS